MTTTAVVAELLVIGMMAAVWLVLLIMAIAGISPTMPEWNKFAGDFKDWNVLLGVLFLGGAYTLGVLMDRLASVVFRFRDKRARVPGQLSNRWHQWGDPSSGAFADYHDEPEIGAETGMYLYIYESNEKVMPYFDNLRRLRQLVRASTLNLALIAVAIFVTEVVGGPIQLPARSFAVVLAALLVLAAAALIIELTLNNRYRRQLYAAYHDLQHPQREV